MNLSVSGAYTELNHVPTEHLSSASSVCGSDAASDSASSYDGGSSHQGDLVLLNNIDFAASAPINSGGGQVAAIVDPNLPEDQQVTVVDAAPQIEFVATVQLDSKDIIAIDPKTMLKLKVGTT